MSNSTGALGAAISLAVQTSTEPTLPKDRLGSKQFTTYVDALGEGIIGGFPSAIDAGYSEGSTNYNNAALKDVYLNNTQVLNSSADVTNLQDTDYNFKDVGFDVRFGSSSQTYIAGISNIETEKAVGVAVENGSPITRSITNTSVTSVRVTVAFPRLEKFEDNGDITGAEVSLSIQIQHNSGGYVTAINDIVKGRSSSAYFRDYIINLSGAFPVDVRVIRNTADSTNTKLVNAFQWSTYTEIIDEQRAYANTAHVALRFDAENFPQIPSRAFKLRGIKTKMYSNATVQSDGSLTFSGAWDGTFKADKESHSDPALILWDLLTNERYGFGSHISESQLSKFDFYAVSVYNNEQIDDGTGTGSTHARFAFNGLIKQQTDAYKLISLICSSMRVMPYWSAGALTISQDSPKDSSYLFTLANVVDGGFSYSGSSIQSRATQVNVSYFDNETRAIDWEEVQDSSLVAKYGIIQKNVKAYGCTDRARARRLGLWMLYTLAHETEIVTFTTSLDAGVCIAPGDVIDIADPVRTGIRRGGRINAATLNTITVDNTDQTDLPTTNDPTLSVVLSDGTVEKRDVTGISNGVITVNANFSSIPNANSIWILENTTAQTSQWRIVSITEAEESLYTVSALAYNASKFDYVEDGAALETRTVSILNAIPNAPTNLAATEQIYEENGVAKVKIITSWQPINGVTQYRIQWRKGNGNFIQTTVSSPDYEILDTTDGGYDIRVFSINAALKPSTNPAELTFTAIGKTAPPADIANLTFEAISANSGRLRWDRSTELDVINGGGVKFKHSSDTTGAATWGHATSLIASKSGSQTEAIVPLIEGEMLVKFFDDGQRESTNATSVIVDLPDTLGALSLLTQREDQLSPTPFSGSKTDVVYDASLDALILEMLGFDGVSSVDAITDFDNVGWGAVDSNGTYNFANKLDLGAVYSLDLKRHIRAVSFLPDDNIDDRVASTEEWADWDGAAQNVDCKLYTRTTQTDPSASPTWSSWQEVANGTHKARGFEFKALLSSKDTDENIQVKELGFAATLQRRQEQSVGAVASGSASGGKTITFSKPFFTGVSGLGGTNAYLPSIGIVGQNLQSGDFVNVTPVTGSNFIVKFMNGSSVVDRNFTWSATGYGMSV